MTTPLDGDDLDAVLQTLVSVITGIPGDLVRPRWQPIPPLQPPAGTLWCALGVTEEDPDANAWLGQTTIATMQRHIDLAVLASFYGPGHRGAASTLRDGLAAQVGFGTITDAGVAFVSSTTIRNVPEKVGEQWLPRCDLPLQFRRQVTRTYATPTIITAPVAIIRG